jgi:hypothetical protein
MGTPQKGYGDHKNRSGGVGWDRKECRRHGLLDIIVQEEAS